MAYVEFKEVTDSSVTVRLNDLDTNVNYERKIMWMVYITIEDIKYGWDDSVAAGSSASNWCTIENLEQKTEYNIQAVVYKKSTGEVVNQYLFDSFTTSKRETQIEVGNIGYYSVDVRLINLQDVNYRREILWSYSDGGEKIYSGSTVDNAHVSESTKLTISGLLPATNYTIFAVVWNYDTNVIVNDDLMFEVTTADPDTSSDPSQRSIIVGEITATSVEIDFSGTDITWSNHKLNIWLNGVLKYSDEKWEYEDPCTVIITNLTPGADYTVRISFYDSYTGKEIDFGKTTYFRTFNIQPFNFTYKGAELDSDGNLKPLTGYEKESGLYFYLLAKEWRRLCNKINTARTKIKGQDEYGFTYVNIDDYFYASIYNEAVDALWFYRQLPKVKPGDNISADLLNVLKDTVNEILGF